MPPNIKLVIFSYAHFIEAIINKENITKLSDIQCLRYVFDTLTEMKIRFVLAPEKNKFSPVESAQFFQLCDKRDTSHTIIPWSRNIKHQESLREHIRIRELDVDLATCKVYAKEYSVEPHEVLLVSRNRTTSSQVMAEGFSTLYLRQSPLIKCLFNIVHRVNGRQTALNLYSIETTFKLMLEEYLTYNYQLLIHERLFITLLENLIEEIGPYPHGFSPQIQTKDSALAALLEQSKMPPGADQELLLQNTAYVCSLENKRSTKTRNIYLETLTNLLNTQTQYAKYRAFIKNGTVSTEDVRKYGQETFEEQQLNSSHTLNVTKSENEDGFIELT